MPVDTKSSNYDEWIKDWNLIKVIYRGDRSVKEAGETITPKLDSQTKSQYDSYKNRGVLYNAFARTVIGLTGAIARKPFVIEVPEVIEGLFDEVTLDGLSLTEVILIVIRNILSYGYFGILTDMSSQNEDNNPYFALYKAFDIFNWRTKNIGGVEKLEFLCLREYVIEEGDDVFEGIPVEQIRVLSIEDGHVVVRLFREIEDKFEQIDVVEGIRDFIPLSKGNPLDTIPFVFIGVNGNIPTATKPPLLDLVTLNIKHWQLTVDYYHGLHYCALPTPWAAGWPPETELFLGPQKAWVSQETDAKAGFLEFSGEGLESIQKALKDLEIMMAVIGARFLEEQKKQTEAADTIKTRLHGDTATLSSIVVSIEKGIKKALQYLGVWLGIDVNPEDFNVVLNKDFASERLTPQEILALLQSLQAAKISWDTFLYNLQTGEILPKGRTIEEEKELVDAEGITQYDESL